MAATFIGGHSTTVTGTMMSLPSVGLCLWSSTMTRWVMPTLYPAKPWSTGSPSRSGQEW